MEKEPGTTDSLIDRNISSAISQAKLEKDKEKAFNLKRDQLATGSILGKGISGDVYSATLTVDDGSTKQVAAKFLRFGNSREEKDQLVDEFETMRKLGDHENVVGLVGLVVDGEAPALVTELVNGPNLENVLKKGKISTRQKYKFALDAAKALEFVHKKGIIHRDVAARNCFVEERESGYGVLKLGDFGEAKDIGKSKQFKLSVAPARMPVAWTAIESLEFLAWTEQSDIWSYGCLLYEIFCDYYTMPYAMTLPEIGVKEVLEFLKSEQRLEVPTSINPALSTLMNQCWHSEPTKRPQLTEIIICLNELMNELQDEKTISEGTNPKKPKLDTDTGSGDTETDEATPPQPMLTSTPPSTEILPTSLKLLINSGQLSKMLSSAGGPCLLFLRHSDHLASSPNTSGADVSLTAAGLDRAGQLGLCLRELGMSPGSLISSPMARNIETIKKICSSAGWEDRIESDKRVMGLGTIYEADANVDEVVVSYCESGFGSYQIFNEIRLGREKRFHGVKPFDDGARNTISLIDEILSRHRNENRLSVVVSDDMHVAYLVSKLFAVEEFTIDTWPPFLDAVLFQLTKRGDEKKLKAVYGDKVVEISI